LVGAAVYEEHANCHDPERVLSFWK
jgi:hypothetical protein